MPGPSRPRPYDTSTDPSRGRGRRRVASALGLLVILFNLVAGTLLAGTTPGAAAPFADEIFGDRIVVCTGAGMIVLDAAGNPVRDDAGTTPMCVFCLPLIQGSAAAPVVIALLDAPLAFEPVIVLPDAVATSTPAPTFTTASPRGPPRV